MGKRSVPVVGALLVAVALAVGSCSEETAMPRLSELGQAGRAIAADAGCAGCHGNQGQGGVGPAWIGLTGSPVELEDGSLVNADGSYLRTAILDPSADLRAGYTIRMPQVDLTDAEVNALIAYIEELR